MSDFWDFFDRELVYKSWESPDEDSVVEQANALLLCQIPHAGDWTIAYEESCLRLGLFELLASIDTGGHKLWGDPCWPIFDLGRRFNPGEIIFYPAESDFEPLLYRCPKEIPQVFTWDVLMDASWSCVKTPQPADEWLVEHIRRMMLDEEHSTTGHDQYNPLDGGAICSIFGNSLQVYPFPTEWENMVKLAWTKLSRRRTMAS